LDNLILDFADLEKLADVVVILTLGIAAPILALQGNQSLLEAVTCFLIRDGALEATASGLTSVHIVKLSLLDKAQAFIPDVLG